jgi:tRNA G18 (ribose-2'-O)-methylase SpoU
LPVIRIDDPADPRVAPYLHVRDRDLVGRGDGFIAEGEVVVRVLLSDASRCRAASLLVAEKRAERLVALAPPDLPVYAASQAAMDAIVGFPIHRGILAHGLRPPDPGAAALLATLPPRALVVALFGIANHDNMGGLLRNAAAFGADTVLLDPTCCDPLYRKAIRVSVGAALRVPFARLAPGDDALALLEGAGFTAFALTPSGGERVRELVRPDRAAVLLGTEGPGLPAELLARARCVAIPMARGWDSLNVAAASSIVLHQLSSYQEGEEQ